MQSFVHIYILLGRKPTEFQVNKQFFSISRFSERSDPQNGGVHLQAKFKSQFYHLLAVWSQAN